MRKIFAVGMLLAALFFGNICAEKIFANDEVVEQSGAVAATDSMNHADSIYFTHPDFANMTSNADRIILSNYPTYQQTTEYSCAPAAALSVLNYFGNRDFDEATLIKRMNTDTHIGTSLGNMVKFFREIGWDVQSSIDTPPIDELTFRQSVAKNLSEGKPIMVENIEFGGHWRVIIGIDTLGTEELYDDVLIFADPYDTSDHNQDGYAIESLDRFFYMWFDHNMLPENERNQPWLIATPKH